ncbi:unnamed protein product [Microthlaspi erraticum]|uniref:Uncharacterized protein n=1 Tax=Microthlaspi erraticum TaxID=1685480 RepID=A0A6D2KGM0_9BRAS|nr:unnamed protein product [Microthlaspi erraticum]CAA7046845.1 unnamed protein product [Microthlaspi erraticum]
MASGCDSFGHLLICSIVSFLSSSLVFFGLQRISFHRCSRLLEVLSSSAILCIAVGRIELLRLSHVAGTFLVLSFGFADQNDVLRSPVKFGGLRSCRLGDGRALSLGSSILAERVVVMLISPYLLGPIEFCFDRTVFLSLLD